ncbi:hypothetical protein BDV11DRAFT_192147 [Aspergillus similis]
MTALTPKVRAAMCKYGVLLISLPTTAEEIQETARVSKLCVQRPPCRRSDPTGTIFRGHGFLIMSTCSKASHWPMTTPTQSYLVGELAPKRRIMMPFVLGKLWPNVRDCYRPSKSSSSSS